MRTLKGLGAALLFLLSACAAAPAAEPVATAGAPAARQGDPKAQWWAQQSWRYGDAAAAEAAYQRLLASQSPWPEWHQPRVVELPIGTRFQMALAPGQTNRQPGGFATFDLIPSVAYVRTRLAVKEAWKPKIDRVVVYEVVKPLPADTGEVGPQIDVPVNRYLPGGASQLEMKVPGPDRISYLKVVDERPIR